MPPSLRRQPWRHERENVPELNRGAVVCDQQLAWPEEQLDLCGSHVVGVLDDLGETLQPITGQELGAAGRSVEGVADRTRQASEQLTETGDGRTRTLDRVGLLVRVLDLAPLRCKGSRRPHGLDQERRADPKGLPSTAAATSHEISEQQIGCLDRGRQ